MTNLGGRRRPRPLRIAFVTAALNPGGSERQMLLIAEGLPRDEFKVDFICLQAAGPYAARARAAGATVHTLSFRGRREWRGGWPSFVVSLVTNALRYVVLTVWRYDIVDAWLYNAYVLASLTRPLTWPRALLGGRRSLSDFKARFTRLQKWSGSASVGALDLIVANSDAVRRDVILREGLDPSRVRVIHNAALPAIAMPPEDRRRRRAAWGASDDTVVVGCVANYKPGKGIELLIGAFAGVVALARRDVRLVLVGDGALRPRLESLRRELGLEGLVTLHGRELEARAIYGAFDVFAFASESEGFPNVVLEAAAAGLAIVATSAGGTVEIIDDGQTGRLVPIGDQQAFGRALAELCDDPDERRRLGAAAAAGVERRYGGPRMVAQFADLYRTMASRGRRPWGRR